MLAAGIILGIGFFLMCLSIGIGNSDNIKGAIAKDTLLIASAVGGSTFLIFFLIFLIAYLTKP